jgi:hypothetical protein
VNSRERARKTLNHQEADRPAIDLGATRMTGTSGWTYRVLKQALGIDLDTVRIYDLFQMPAEVETPVLDALGCDKDGKDAISCPSCSFLATNLVIGRSCRCCPPIRRYPTVMTILR